MWQYVYYIIAAVNILTISFNFLLHKNTVDVFCASVNHQKKWVAIEDEFGVLVPIFTDAKLSTNDIFQSKNIKKEIDKFDTAYRVFQVKIHQLEEAFTKRVSENNTLIRDKKSLKIINTLAHDLQEKMKNLRGLMEMIRDATKNCFSEIQVGNKEKASEYISKADRINTKASFEVLECVRSLNNLECYYMDDYVVTTSFFEAVSSMVALFVLIMMICAILYGYYLAGKIRKDEDIKEQYKKNLQKSLKEGEIAKQAAEKKEIQMRQFLTYLSQEFSTPLNGILGFVHTLIQESAEKHLQHYIESIKHAANSLLTHIKEISEFAKLESGKLVLDDSPYNIKQALLETIHIILFEAQKKRISVCLDFVPSIQEHVKGDKARLQQVFINLLGNALKFTARGSINIRVSAEKVGPGYIKYTFSIKDSGTGIAEDKQKIIFEKFSQADDSIGAMFGGAGLGLAIAKEIILLMKGDITVSSKEGEGATFTFTFITEEQPNIAVPKIQKIDRQIVLLSENPINTKLLEPSLKEISVKVKILNDLESLSQVDSNAILFMSPAFVAASEAPRVLEERSRDTFILDMYYDPVVEQSGKYQKLAGYLHHPMTGDMLYRAIHMLTSEENTGEFIDNKSITIKDVSSEFSAEDLKFDQNFDILVAEDNVINQEVIKIYLKKLGVNFAIAQNGNEAVELFKDKKFDLVFMDYQMPELNGVDATKLIREYEKTSNQKKTPIIAYTPYTLEKVNKECLAAGMNDILVKPIKIAELHAKIKQWCKTI